MMPNKFSEYQNKIAKLNPRYFMSIANGEVKTESDWSRDWHYRDLNDDRQFNEFWEDQQLIEVEQYETKTHSGKIVKKWRPKEK